MKNVTRLKLAVATLSLSFLGACSTPMHTFAPGTGAYHGQEKTTEVAKTETIPTEATPAISETVATTAVATPVAQASAAAKTATALSQNLNTEKATAQTSGTEQQANQKSMKQLKK